MSFSIRDTTVKKSNYRNITSNIYFEGTDPTGNIYGQDNIKNEDTGPIEDISIIDNINNEDISIIDNINREYTGPTTGFSKTFSLLYGFGSSGPTGSNSDTISDNFCVATLGIPANSGDNLILYSHDAIDWNQ